MRVGWGGLKPLMGKYLARTEAMSVVSGTLGPLFDLPTYPATEAATPMCEMASSGEKAKGIAGKIEVKDVSLLCIGKGRPLTLE